MTMTKTADQKWKFKDINITVGTLRHLRVQQLTFPFTYSAKYLFTLRLLQSKGHAIQIIYFNLFIC